MSGVTEQVSASLDALTKEFEIITHNLANANTVGFKRRCNAFSKVLEAQGAGSPEYHPESLRRARVGTTKFLRLLFTGLDSCSDSSLEAPLIGTQNMEGG